MSEALSVHHGDFGRAALYNLDRPMVTHAHREGHLIFHVGGSRARMRVGGEVVPFDAATGAAISPWEPHSFETVEPGPCLNLVLYIKPMWFLEMGRSAEFALSFGARRVERDEKIDHAVRRLTSLLLEVDSSSRFDGYLFELTSLCFEQTWRGVDAREHDATGYGRFVDYRVRRSLRLMQEKFSEAVEMDWLAKEAGLSRPHFFKLFKRQMGITPNIYLNTLRSEQAIDELTNSEKTVTDISYDLGFSSQASFTRFFTANVGIPPSDYRRVAHVS